MIIGKRKRITQKDVIDGLGHLAFGDVQDAITLLFETEDSILSTLPGLDLFNISEIKRQKGGGMEIKFFDRLKALEKLREIIDDDKKQDGTSFYDALEKSAAGLKNEYEVEDDD